MTEADMFAVVTAGAVGPPYPHIPSPPSA